MPDRVRWLPNERVDVEDLSHATGGLEDGSDFGFAEQSDRRWLKRGWLDAYARVLEGFRVIQTTTTGQFTIINGVSVDRDGTVLENEEDANARRSYTLPNPGTTYYVEVVLTGSETGTDARAFRDPTFDNGTDPSGDAKQPGREYNQNVATRWRPDWDLVLPVSTTAFARDATPNTTRIPMAILVTDGGGAIVNGAVPPVSARTVLAEDALATATSIRVFNSRHLPDSFTASIGAEAAHTISANDRENGILTVSTVGGLVGNQSVGALVIDTDAVPDLLLTERATPAIVGATTQDARPRMWAADENRGGGLLQSPYSATASTDLQIQSLKDQVDFNAGLFRAAFYGSALEDNLGTVAPRTTFTAAPRYFEVPASIPGSRGHTVSVGDGTNSWGDFNVSGYADAQACLAAAVAAMPGTGGTLLLKRGTYSIVNTTLTLSGFTNLVSIVGEGQDATVIEITGTAAAITVSGNPVSLTRLTVSRNGGTSDYSVVVTGASSGISTSFATIESLHVSGATSEQYFVKTSFLCTGGLGIACRIESLNTRSTTFDTCYFKSSVAAAGSRAMYISAVYYLRVQRSWFVSQPGSDYVIEGAGVLSEMSFVDTIVTGAPAAVGIWFSSTGTITEPITFERCWVTGTLSGYRMTQCLNVRWIDCVTTYGTDGYGIYVDGASTVKAVTIRGGTINQTTTGGAKAGYGVQVDNGTHIRIDGVQTVDCDTGILLSGAITDGKVTHPRIAGTATKGHHGVLLSGTLTRCSVVGAEISDLGDFDGSSVTAGVRLTMAANSTNVTVRDCHISVVGGASTQYARGVLVDGAFTMSTLDVAGNQMNNIIAQGAAGEAGGVVLASACFGAKVINNNINGVDALNLAYGVYAATYDDLDVSGNTAVFVGNAALTGTAAGILVGFGAAVPGDATNLTIATNRIRQIDPGGGAGYGISMVVGVLYGTVTGNQIFPPAGQYGIYVAPGAGGGSPDASNLTVSGNSVYGGAATAYYLEGAKATDIHLTVSGNVGAFYTTSGILCGVADAAVTGNVLYTGTNVADAIVCAADDIAVTGNRINHPALVTNGATHRFLIAFGAQTGCSAVGNQITAALFTDAAWACGIGCDAAAQDCWAASNRIKVGAAASAPIVNVHQQAATTGGDYTPTAGAFMNMIEAS